jgi:GDPmannose 4,6-dehydratase
MSYGKKCLITGITGQDGSFLSELLLSKGYEVHGIIRRASTPNDSRIEHLNGLQLHYSDLSDGASLVDLIYGIAPDEIYSLGAQSHVRISFDVPEYTADITGSGTLRLLEAIRKSGIKARFYQAGSSEQFGSSLPPQNEQTLFRPESPYAVAKIFSYHMVHVYRKAYKIFASNGICFNHESERRGDNFVTRKITKAAARIKCGLQDKLFLGNIDALRDWGYAKDYVKAMYMMLQHDEPDDFVIATGEAHSVREFLEIAFDKLGLDPYKYVEFDDSLKRASEVDFLQGDPSKIKRVLGWEPETTFDELVNLMVNHDLTLAEKESRMKSEL